MKTILLSFILFTTSANAKDEAKKIIVEQLIERSASMQKLALKDMQQQFKVLQSPVLLAEENDKLTTDLLSEIQTYFKSSLKKQEKMFENDGLKELENLQAYLKRQADKSLAIAKIENLEEKVSNFFKSGESLKIPESKLTLINDYFYTTKLDEIQKDSLRVSKPFIRKTLGLDKKLSKKELDKMVDQVIRKTTMRSRLHFLYTHNLQKDEDLKMDLDFFKTKGYERYLENQMTDSRRQTEIMMKHMTKLMDKIDKAEQKNAKKK
jgi:hypothetical protein